jgi:hypothetical protein
LKTFIGTKVVKAKPITRGEYNAYRGWTPPEGEEQNVDGYLVEYTDGGTPNHPDHAGYVSWSPKEQFDGAYRETSGLPFGLAVEAAKKGLRVTRATWPLGVFVYFVPPASYPVQTGAAKSHFGEGSLVPYLAYLAIKRVDDQVCVFCPGMDSILADDWHVVE